MPEDDLEKVIEQRKKLVEIVMHKFLGVTIKEMNEDITSRLSYPFEYIIDTGVSFKRAKKMFVRSYLVKLLKKHLGNISDAARAAGINRRTIHRLISDLDIEIESIRKFLLRPHYMMKDEMNRIIEGSLKKYDEYIHPSKLDEMYRKVSDASEDILKTLPERTMTLKEAEESFEKAYLEKALSENGFDEPKTAKKIGIRYETLHRKWQRLRNRNQGKPKHI
jgi:DNA-binding NtrC family response regulator